MVSEPLATTQPVPVPPTPAAHVEFHQDGEGQGRPLPLGRAVTGVVARLLEHVGGQYRYELAIQDQTFVVTTPRSYPVGTVLDLLTLVGEPGGVRLAVRGTEPPEELQVVRPDSAPASTTTRDGAEAPRHEPRASSVLEEQVARALRRAGAAPEGDLVDRIVRQIREQGLLPHAAARAAGRLVAAGVPPLAELVRGGALLEASPAVLDLGPAVERLARAVEATLPTASPAGAEVRSRIVALLRDGAEAVPMTSTAMAARVRPEIVLRALDALVKVLLDGDAALARVRAELTALDGRNPGSGADLQARVEQLLRSEAGGHPHLDDLRGAARGRALEVLHELERSLVERNPEVRELRNLIREVHQRLEATTYAQLLEWVGLDDRDPHLVTGLWGEQPGRFPFRVTVRDRREGGQDGPLRFVLEVESTALGRVHVTGELDTTSASEGRKLTLHLGSEESATHARITASLDDLITALRTHDYDPRATVGLLAAERPSETVEDSVSDTDRLDVKV